MRLNKKDIAQLRNHIQNNISEAIDLPEASIHLEKELLEQLIFMKKTVWFGGKSVEIKFPIWTGNFLRKIDLSEVSFDSVVWNKKAFCEVTGISYKEAGEYDCDLSYTNAKIDFSKAIFLHKYSLNPMDSYMHIRRIDFIGVNLTNSHIEEIYGAECVNFKGAHGDFSSIFDRDKKFTSCDFDSVSIKHEPILVRDFYDNFTNCDFSNTGIDIIYDPKREGLEIGKELLADDIQNRNLDNCFINHVQIDPYKEAIKKEAEKEYTGYQKRLYGVVNKAIEDGIAQGKKE